MATQVTAPEKALKEIFRKPAIRQAWHGSVKDGFRNQVLIDLHDYIDVRRNIGELARSLRHDVVKGVYRSRRYEIIHSEKGLGITRRLIVPSPEDAIVLQTIVDNMEKKIISSQKSKQSYYSRSHSRPNITSFDADLSYPWWMLWPEFQEQIWEFSRAADYLVVTDIANYFDCIPLNRLRQKVSSLSKFDEHSLDFLFYVLESFVWRPMYIPHSGNGLPQINFDAPRLLAHAYLFKIDDFLTNKLGNNFVRWMDDIDFGVDSIAEARSILKELDEQLAMIGLRLNTKKTKILTSRQAFEHFKVRENVLLNRITEAWKKSKTSKGEQARLKSLAVWLFLRFYNGGETSGHWDKILKRYINLFGRINDDVLDPFWEEIYKSHASCRSALHRYYIRLGYSTSRLKIVLDTLRDKNYVDDVTRYGLTETLVYWAIPAHSRSVPILADLGDYLVSRTVRTVSQQRSNYFCGLMLVSKYAGSKRLYKYIVNNQRIWQDSSYLQRQIASVTPLLQVPDEVRVISLLKKYSFESVMSVLTTLADIRSIKRVLSDVQLRKYILHKPSSAYPYPLSKFILVNAVLQGSIAGHDKDKIVDWLAKYVDDPVYVSRIAHITK